MELQNEAKSFFRDLQEDIGEKAVAVMLDKDPKRRCFMSVRGYIWRFLYGYLLDEKFYTWKHNAIDDLIEYKTLMVKKYLPIRCLRTIQNIGFPLAYAYHTYKAKCLGHRQLVCNKTHMHEREIVSDVANF